MIERRNFLKTCLAAMAMEAACSRDKQAPQISNAGGAVKNAKDISVDFRGFCLFLLSSSYNSADVALVKTETVNSLKPHFGTLRIPRESITSIDDTFPVVAADADYIHASLANAVLQILPSPLPANPNLMIGHDPISANVNFCGTDNWSTINWLLDIKRDLFPGAVLDSKWQMNPSLFGRVELRYGRLEKDLGTDGEPHFFYDVYDYTSGTAKPAQRLLKDRARCSLQASVAEFRIGSASCVMNTSDGRPANVLISHVPAAWMKDGGDLRDFQALYNLFDYSSVSKPGVPPVPSNRKICGNTPGATSGCECCPTSMMLV